VDLCLFLVFYRNVEDEVKFKELLVFSDVGFAKNLLEPWNIT